MLLLTTAYSHSCVSLLEHTCAHTCDGVSRELHVTSSHREGQAETCMMTNAGTARQKKSKYSSSSAFFGQLQDQRDAAGKSGPVKVKLAPGPSSKALKL